MAAEEAVEEAAMEEEAAMVAARVVKTRARTWSRPAHKTGYKDASTASLAAREVSKIVAAISTYNSSEKEIHNPRYK